MQHDFRPLEGIRVVDVSHVIAGPFATFHLAQMGADVLKIESPAGDVMRRNARGLQAFVAFNAGKRKVRLDLATPEGLARAKAEVQGADVFVDNLRPGASERLGLGWQALKAINPRLVYCSISGFGRDVARPAYDHVVQAATGMTLASGAETDPPQKIGFPLIDAGAGIIAALAIVSALRERDRRGGGAPGRPCRRGGGGGPPAPPPPPPAWAARPSRGVRPPISFRHATADRSHLLPTHPGSSWRCSTCSGWQAWAPTPSCSILRCRPMLPLPC